MFARQRDPGLWTFDSVITGAELEYWDAAIAVAIDGQNGGAYSLASDVSIGSSPFRLWTFDMLVQFTDTTLFSSDVTFNDDVSFVGADVDFQDGVFTMGASGADAFTVNAFTTYNDLVIFNGQTFFNDDASFGADVTLGGGSGDAIVCAGYFNAQTTAAFQSSVTFFGPAVADADFTFQSTVEFAGITTTTGSGYVKARKVSRQAIGGDADASYSPLSYDHVHVHASTLGASRNYTIDDTGAVDGDRMEFSTKDVGFAINVKKPGGTQIAQLVGNTHMACVVARVAGTWTLISYSDYILH